MKVSTENDNNFGYEKITILVDNIPLSQESEWLLYLCVSDIGFASFYDFSIGCWKCSDSVVFFVFLLDFGNVLTVWYFLFFYWILEMFWQCGIFCFSIGCWNCSDSVVFFVFLLDFGTVPTVWYFCFSVYHLDMDSNKEVPRKTSINLTEFLKDFPPFIVCLCGGKWRKTLSRIMFFLRITSFIDLLFVVQSIRGLLM